MKKFLILLMLSVFMIGCVSVEDKSPTQLTYNTFKTAEDVYKGGMSTVGDLYKMGKITDTEKDEIIELGWKFKLAYDSASIAFSNYKETPSFDNEESMNNLIKDLEDLKHEFKRWIYERQ